MAQKANPQTRDSREYHIQNVSMKPGNFYTWIRTDGLLNTYNSPQRFWTLKDCKMSIKRDADKLGIKALIIRS